MFELASSSKIGYVVEYLVSCLLCIRPETPRFSWTSFETELGQNAENRLYLDKEYTI